MQHLAKFAVPAGLLFVAWKFGKLSPKEIAVVGAVALAFNIAAPRLPVVGPALSA